MKNNLDKEYFIRDFETQDYEQVDNIWTLTGMGGKQRGDDLTIINNSIEHGGKLLVLAENENQRVIGTSWMTHDFRRIYLHHFAIHPDYQKQGLGEFLAIASLQFAKEKNMQIKLEVHKENTAAINLYKKIGFNYLGDYLVYIIRDVHSI